MDDQVVMNAPWYNLPDILAVSVILFCAFGGWLRGLSGELARLATVLLALVLGLRLREPLAGRLRDWTSLDTPVDSALAFTVLAIGILIALALVFRLLRRIMQISFSPGLEKGGGTAAGLLRGLVLVLTVFVMFNLWPHPRLNHSFGEASLLGRGVRRFLLPQLRERLKDIDRMPVTPPADATTPSDGA